MRSIIKPGAILFIIAAIAAALLGFVNQITAKPIAEQREKTKAEAMLVVLPDVSTFEENSDFNIEPTNIKNINIGYDNSNNIIGYAFNVTSKGYGGEISIMVGLSTEGKIQGINVVSHSETPGLGANSTDPKFTDQYKEKSGKLSVTKNAPGESEIQAITSATITSKAVTDGVNEVLDFYEQNLKNGISADNSQNADTDKGESE